MNLWRVDGKDADTLVIDQQELAQSRVEARRVEQCPSGLYSYFHNS